MSYYRLRARICSYSIDWSEVEFRTDVSVDASSGNLTCLLRQALLWSIAMVHMNGNMQRENRNRQPSDSVEIGDTLGHLWISDDGQRIHWSLARRNRREEGREYKTLRPEDLPDAIEAIAVLSGAFSHAPILAERLKQLLSQLSHDLKIVAEKYKSGLAQQKNGDARNSYLSLAR
ncbi:MAG: hypothetical protein KDA60_00785 [Planctomycetales bacterium]|nr:hypothetical protein [Planctomycetales bacterium]